MVKNLNCNKKKIIIDFDDTIYKSIFIYKINEFLGTDYKLEDFKNVIDKKVGQWLNNPKYEIYLRPSTLFAPSHFEDYLNECLVEPKKEENSYEYL